MEALELVKFKGSRKLMETLLKFPKRKFTINELSKESKVPFASTWRLVSLWNKAGIIETGRIGKSVTVMLGSSKYLKTVTSMLELSMSPQAFTASELKELLSRDKKVKEAYLFGSVATGNENPESDIDLALLAEKSFNAGDLIFKVYDEYGAKIVPLVFTGKHELESFLKGKQSKRLL